MPHLALQFIILALHALRHCADALRKLCLHLVHALISGLRLAFQLQPCLVQIAEPPLDMCSLVLQY